MRNLKSLLLVAVASTSLVACAGYQDADRGYLGSRDDILVNGQATTNVAKDEVKSVVTNTVKKKIETVKEGADSTVMNSVAMDNVVMKSDATVTTSAVATTSTPSIPTPALPPGISGEIPPNARTGECYAKVLFPAKYETKTERFQISEEQQVFERMIPAQYEVKTERVKVKDARKYWKSGKGPITRVDQVTGEILCLVEEPAEYRTITKQVLISPEKPVYQTVPAKFDTVTKRNMIQAERWEWQRILCETNLSSDAILKIQGALSQKGYPVNVEGVLGQDTLRAIDSYQLTHGLASRGITHETLSHMGVSLVGMGV